MKKFLRLLNPIYWINVLKFGKYSADARCSIFNSGVDNSAIQAHSISRELGLTKKTRKEWIAEAKRCVEAGGDRIRK